MKNAATLGSLRSTVFIAFGPAIRQRGGSFRWWRGLRPTQRFFLYRNRRKASSGDLRRADRGGNLMTATVTLTDRVTGRLIDLRLATAAREWVPRFSQAALQGAFPLVVEITRNVWLSEGDVAKPANEATSVEHLVSCRPRRTAHSWAHQLRVVFGLVRLTCSPIEGYFRWTRALTTGKTRLLSTAVRECSESHPPLTSPAAMIRSDWVAFVQEARRCCSSVVRKHLA